MAPNQNSLVTTQFHHLRDGLPSQRYFSFPSSGREEDNAGTGDTSAGPRETLQGDGQRGRLRSPLGQVHFLAAAWCWELRAQLKYQIELKGNHLACLYALLMLKIIFVKSLKFYSNTACTVLSNQSERPSCQFL